MVVPVLMTSCQVSDQRKIGPVTAQTMTVLIGMFLVGVFIGLGTWLVSWSDDKKRELAVHVFIADTAKEPQINELRVLLESDERVKPGGITFISKAKALEIMRKRNPELTENLASNPLPASFDVIPVRGEDTEAIVVAESPLTFLLRNSAIVADNPTVTTRAAPWCAASNSAMSSALAELGNVTAPAPRSCTRCRPGTVHAKRRAEPEGTYLNTASYGLPPAPAFAQAGGARSRARGFDDPAVAG